MDRRDIDPWQWQEQFGFVQATEISSAQRVLYCAGQTSVSDEGKPVHAGDMRAQITQSLDNLETVLQKAGYSLAEVARLTYYTTDVDTFLASYDVAVDRLTKAGRRPPMTLLGVTRLAFPELMVEIEATAVK